MVAMARDPYWLHAYWELAGDEQRHAGDRPRIIRVYQLSGPEFSPGAVLRSFDLEPSWTAQRWFIEVGQASSWWCLELGVFGDRGFLSLVRSNVVQTPADAPSDEIDPAWPAPHVSLFDSMAQPFGHLSSHAVPGQTR